MKHIILLLVLTILFPACASYGYEYEVIDDGAHYGYNDYIKIGSISYADAMAKALANNVTPERNLAGELSFKYQKDGQTRLVWFNDATSMNDKVKLAKTYGLKGVAIFKLDGHIDPAFWPKI